MGRKCCQPECHSRCYRDHQALLMQLEFLQDQAQKNKQKFMAYLLGMAVLEAQAILECAQKEAALQSGTLTKAG